MFVRTLPLRDCEFTLEVKVLPDASLCQHEETWIASSRPTLLYAEDFYECCLLVMMRAAVFGSH